MYTSIHSIFKWHLNGEKHTSVTLHLIDMSIDKGAIIHPKK